MTGGQPGREPRTTTRLHGDDLVITPSGDRLGRVRATFPAGALGNQPGVVTVQLYLNTVVNLTEDALPHPHGWVTVPEDAVWTLIVEDRQTT